MIAKILEVYKKLNIRYTTAILFYAIWDILLYVFGILTVNFNGIIAVLAAVVTILGYTLLIEIKVSYPQCFETVNLWIYVVILFILPFVGTIWLEEYIVTDNFAREFNINGLMYLIAKLILYVRTYILAKKYKLDFK